MSDNVPFLDLSYAYKAIAPDLEAAALRVLRSSLYIGGPEVENFEERYAAYVGSSYAAGVSNGLSALHLALLACGVGQGDEVIVPSNTFIATWLAVSHCGATPVPVEPTSGLHTIDAAVVAEKFTERTKAVIPVHLYGQAADISPIIDFARPRNVRVIEDAAQAQGTCYRGTRIGAHSDAVAWSFYPGKNLGAFGDAGMVTTNLSDIDAQIRLLRNYGSQERYVHQLIGYNSRLDPLQAALLSTKLDYLDAWNEERRLIAQYYLKTIDNPVCYLPTTPQWSFPVWHQFVIECADRNSLRAWLKENGIDTLVHYPTPPHMQSAYRDHIGAHLIYTEKLAQTILSLPIYPGMPEDHQHKVVEAINSFKPNSAA